ncbi:MAG: 5-carboxymethyl-2-hydroxymuconate Delta-isomerase [Rhodobacteraceae bacterium]|nr:5-carboxymethyl-2-hydroxymuconate Delta-isomerase [Paracoccaceae bacterium]PHR53620.1 MAG: 5-carboxymethyl-2-hydroxymuconate isomerase [Robiginitomaculum sp.]
MPHLIIEYSANLDPRVDMAAACETLRVAMIRTGVFPCAGVRVRAHRAELFSLADAHSDNAFAHLQIRIGSGRDLATRRRAGEALMQEAQAIFAEELLTGYFALSLEICEIDAATSWKANPIHARLALTEPSEK